MVEIKKQLEGEILSAVRTITRAIKENQSSTDSNLTRAKVITALVGAYKLLTEEKRASAEQTCENCKHRDEPAVSSTCLYCDPENPDTWKWEAEE